LVLAAALACWWAERGAGWFEELPDPNSRSVIDQAPEDMFLT
jgi:hypothetical protein